MLRFAKTLLQKMTRISSLRTFYETIKVGQMKNFHFRLDSVLRYRKYMERTTQIKLSIAEQAFIQCKDKLDFLRRLQRTFFTELEQEEQKGMSAYDYQIYKLYIEKINADIESEQEHLQELIVKMEQGRKELEAASIKRKSLERLREIEYSRYKKEANLFEQKVSDELILLRRGLNNNISKGWG